MKNIGKDERDAKVDTEERTSITMTGNGRYKPVFFLFMFLGVLLLIIGADYTESGANELDNGPYGEFFVSDFEEELAIIVVVDEVEANCEEFVFLLEDEQYNSVPVEKTSCKDWSSPYSYQFRIHNLSAGRYNYEATNFVSILAVEGDVDAFMEDYQLGNSLADIGNCFCCLSFVAPFILGRLSKQALDPANHIQLTDSFVMPTPYEGPLEGSATEPDAEDHGSEAATEESDAEPTTEVIEAALTTGVEEEPSEGAFWGGLKDD